jgi:hypothetical protein
MNDRSTVRLVGVLFIAADVAAIPAGLLHQPVAGGGGGLAAVALDAPGIALGALLGMLMGLIVAAIAIVIHPVLRLVGERLALGYVAVRLLEGALEVLAALAWLTLVAVSRSAAGSVAVGGAGVPDAGTPILALLDQLTWVLKPIVFGIGAVALNAGLYRSRLVPRWLSGWGLVGAGLWVVAGVIVGLGVDRSALLAAPIGLQEIALAAWLIVKGFDPRALARPVAGVASTAARPTAPAAAGAA